MGSVAAVGTWWWILKYRAGPSVNYASAAGDLSIHVHGHHITLVLHGLIPHTGLGAAPPWLLGGISY